MTQSQKLKRCCLTCEHYRVKEQACYEGGYSDIGDAARELTMDDCNAWEALKTTTYPSLVRFDGGPITFRERQLTAIAALLDGRRKSDVVVELKGDKLTFAITRTGEIAEVTGSAWIESEHAEENDES